MRRFNYDDNEEYREDVDNFFGDGAEMSPEEYHAMMEEERAMQELQIRFVNRELNHRVVRVAVRMCEKSFFWRFLSFDARMKMIDRAYKRLKKLEEEE